MSRRVLRVALGLLALAALGCAKPPQPLGGLTFEGGDLKPLPQPSFDELLGEADGFRDAGDVSRAALTYLRALSLDPDKRAPRERIGFLLLSKNDPDRAQTSFETALRSDPNSALANAGLGLALLCRGELAGAEKALLRAVELDPQALLPIMALGALYDSRKEYATAQSYYQKAGALAPQQPDVENNLGYSFLASGDFAAAAEHLELAVRLDPSNRAAQNNLGLALGRLERYDAALVAFRASGDEAGAQNNLGYVHFLNRDYEEAQRCFELALRASPKDRQSIVRNLKRVEDALGLGSAVSAIAESRGAGGAMRR